MNHYGKSRFVRPKQSTKSGIEDNTPEEEQLKKYREIIERLEGEFKNKSGKVKMGSLYSNSINTGGASKGNNKSSYMRRTTSRTKEVLNDRDFLINFMNNDVKPFIPKNMHLLSDNDTNQSISDDIKFQNLANLMIDDKETVVESHFMKNVDDKMILKLYTALSRKSKEVFMDEKHEEQSKNRVLLHKLNDIKIPIYEIYDPILNDEKNVSEDKSSDSNESNKEYSKKSINQVHKKNLEKNIKSFKKLVDSNEEENDKKEEEKEQMNDNKLKFNKDCKYNKKGKENVIKIPKLEPYNPYLDKYHTSRFHKYRPKNEWDPEIDGDFLAYINHNIISIEDIYNKDKAKDLNKNNPREDEVKPIEAKEVFYENNSTIQNKSDNNSINTYDNGNKDKKDKSSDNSRKKELSNIEEENETKPKNKFCEYKDLHPNLIEISLSVDPSKQKQHAFHNELKDIFYSRINEIGEYSEDIFPPKGVDLLPNKIYRYALNNERNEEVSTDRITILSTKKSSPITTPKSQGIEKNLTKRKKTMYYIYNKRKISGDDFMKKKVQDNSNININVNFSALLKKENEKIENENKSERSKPNENKEENNISNNFDNTYNFSLIEKRSQNNDENSLDKKSLTDNLNKIFTSRSFKSNNEDIDNNNKNSIGKENNVSENNNINKDNDNNKNLLNGENNEENQNEISLKFTDNKFNNQSNLSDSNPEQQENKSKSKILSFSGNSGD